LGMGFPEWIAADREAMAKEAMESRGKTPAA